MELCSSLEFTELQLNYKSSWQYFPCIALMNAYSDLNFHTAKDSVYTTAALMLSPLPFKK